MDSDNSYNYSNKVDFSNNIEFVVSDLINDVLKEDDDNWMKVREKRIKELKGIYKKDKLVLFLGAGVSKDAGISDWDDLMSDLLIFIIMKKLNEKDIKITSDETDFIIRKMKETNYKSPLLQSEFIKAALGDSFEESLAELLYKNINNNGDSELLSSISRLCLKGKSGIGIKSIITYNFDDLLEEYFSRYNIPYCSLYSELDYTTSDKLGIYHVHGFIPRNFSEYEKLSEGLLVFSEDRYHSLYNDPYSWTNMTQLNFLRENTTIMIGLSLTDPNLRRILSIANRKNTSKKHYAFMKRRSFKIYENEKSIKSNILKSFDNINNDLHEKSFEQLGINIIWFEEYSDVPTILERIRG